MEQAASRGGGLLLLSRDRWGVLSKDDGLDWNEATQERLASLVSEKGLITGPIDECCWVLLADTSTDRFIIIDQIHESRCRAASNDEFQLVAVGSAASRHALQVFWLGAQDLAFMVATIMWKKKRYPADYCWSRSMWVYWMLWGVLQPPSVLAATAASPSLLTQGIIHADTAIFSSILKETISSVALALASVGMDNHPSATTGYEYPEVPMYSSFGTHIGSGMTTAGGGNNTRGNVVINPAEIESALASVGMHNNPWATTGYGNLEVPMYSDFGFSGNGMNTGGRRFGTMLQEYAAAAQHAFTRGGRARNGGDLISAAVVSLLRARDYYDLEAQIPLGEARGQAHRAAHLPAPPADGARRTGTGGGAADIPQADGGQRTGTGVDAAAAAQAGRGAQRTSGGAAASPPADGSRRRGGGAALQARERSEAAKKVQSVMAQALAAFLPACVTAYPLLKDTPDHVKLTVFGGLAFVTVGSFAGFLSKSVARRGLVIRLVSISAITILTFSIATQLSSRAYVALTAILGVVANVILMLLRF